MYLLAFVLELRVECSLAAHWGQNSMVCRLRRLAEPTSRWFQMFSHRGPVPPNHGCLLCNLPIAAEVHPHNHANYSVRMRMDRTHTYIIYYSIYNIIYIYVCVIYISYILYKLFYMYINCVKCLQPVLVFNKCRPCFHPACAGMHPVWWSAWTSMIVRSVRGVLGSGLCPHQWE